MCQIAGVSKQEMISSAGCRSHRKLCGDQKSNEFTVKLIIYNYHCDFYHSKSRWSITSSKPILVDVAGWTSSTNLFFICHLSFIIQNHLFKSIYLLSFIIQNHLFQADTSGRRRVDIQSKLVRQRTSVCRVDGHSEFKLRLCSKL